MIARTWGVWADRGAVLVRTPGFALVFERTGERLSAALVRVETGDETLTFDTRALASFDPRRDRTVLKARDPEFGDEFVFDNDVERELAPGRVELTSAAVTGDGLVLGREGRIVERLAGGRLETILPSGRTARLVRLERIIAAEPRPGTPADPGNIARCLQSWPLGTGIYRNDRGTFRSVTIGTNCYSFGFSYGALGEEDILHCRAARVWAGDTGATFAPFFRLLARGGQGAAGAVPDLKTWEQHAAVGLVPGEESAVSGLAAENWRVVGVEPDGIELESRAGGRYRLARPEPGNPALVEWFEYQAGLDLPTPAS